MVLVIIILVAWVVILGPSMIKRRARSGGDQSITHFHHQLRILEHSAPEPIVAPAYRLRTVDGSGSATAISYPDRGVRPKLTVVGAKQLPRPALAFLGEPAPAPGVTPTAEALRAPRDVVPDDHPPDRFDDGYAVHDGGPTTAGRVRPARDEWAGPGAPPVVFEGGARGDALARTQARRRRRDTLSVLVAAFVLSLLAGAVTGASAALALCALVGVTLVAYVALLAHLRRRAFERERKLHYLDGRDDRRPARTGGPPTYVSGRYAHPSNQQAVAR
jgi:hypothetical protein